MRALLLLWHRDRPAPTSIASNEDMKIIGLIRTLAAVVASVFLCNAVMAQGTSLTELGGARVPPAGNPSVQTTATFAIGITFDNGLSWRASVTPTDALRLVGKVRPEASQIGQSVDIYLLAKAGAVILMRRTDGAFEQWSGNLSELKPYRQQTRLAADTEIDLFTGQFGVTGQFELFLGYRSTDGVLHYSPAPFNLNINTNPQGASSPWFFNGTVWQSNGTAPACQSPLLQAPFDLGKVTSIRTIMKAAVLWAGPELGSQGSPTQALLRSIPTLETPPKSVLPTIPGLVAGLGEHTHGCRFCQRMGRKSSRTRERPKFNEVTPGHWLEICKECSSS